MFYLKVCFPLIIYRLSGIKTLYLSRLRLEKVNVKFM